MRRVSGVGRQPFADGTVPLSVWPMALAGVALGLALAVLTVRLTAPEPAAPTLPAGAHVGDVDVGHLTPDQAVGRIQEQLAGWLAHPVTLTLGERRWEPSLHQIGGRVDVAGAVARLADGQPGSLLRRLGLRAASLDEDLALMLDETTLRGYLQGLAAEVNQPAADAGLVLHGATVQVVKARQGRALDIDRAVAAIRAAVHVQQAADVQLSVAVAEPVHGDAYVAAAQERLQQLLAGPLTVKAADHSYVLDLPKLAGLARLAPTPDGASLAVTLDEAKLDTFLAGVASDVEVRPKNAKFGFDGARVTTVTPAKDGRKLDVAKAKETLQAAAFAPERTVELALVTVPGETGSDPERMGIRSLVARGGSNFAGSPKERVHNVLKMADLLNGSVVAPGAVFSFNQVMGDVGEDAGWAEGLVIADGRTKPGLGGGICQVSTTLFRAVFKAGLPVLERHDHAYPVPYYTQGGYPEGFDATVWSPTLDFKFQNDTPGYLLIQANADPGSMTMTVALYGTAMDRKVDLVGPVITNRKSHPPDLKQYDPKLPKGVIKQTDWAHDGFDAVIKRIIKDGSGNVVHEDSFASHYEAWQAVISIGTGGVPADKMPPLAQPASSATPAPSPSPAPIATPSPARPSPSPPPPAAAPKH